MARRAEKSHPTKQRRSARVTPGILFLRQHSFRTLYGEETECGIYPNTSANDYVARDRAGWSHRRLANYHFHDHFDSKRTLFYFGNGARSAPFTLIKIDIDIQKSRKQGTREGALALLARLKELWPKLYSETSRSGNGINAWFRLRKIGLTAAQVNVALKRFAAWLRAEANGFDIEGVEVKGHCPELTYSKYGDLQHIKYGTFARFPRNAEACSLTQVVSVGELGNLEMREPDGTPQPHQVPHPSGWIIEDEDLERLPALEKAVGNLRMKAGRWAVTAKDWAQFFLLCILLPENKDGSNGYRRYQAVWQELYAAGTFTRAFNYHRFKAMRDWLSQHGHVEWLDERYCPGNGDRDGIATKWRISDELRDWMEDVHVAVSTKEQERGGSLLTLDQLKRGRHDHRIPVRADLWSEKEAEWHLMVEARLQTLFVA